MTGWERHAPKLAVALGSAAATLGGAVAWLALRQRVTITPAALRDPQVQQLAVERLVQDTASIFDSHPDTDVSRVLLPDLSNVPFHGVPVTSNHFGMRERDYRIPKPAGVVRVVLLGDSFVFGYGVHARHRLGVFLQRELRARGHGAAAGEVEVLHVAVGSWNTIAECAYLLRNLHALDPDLVVQVYVTNDLDDNAGVRGVGLRSDFDPMFPGRGDARVSGIFPVQEWGSEDNNPILDGVDWESRTRYELARTWLERLDRALEARGLPYLFVCTASGVYGKVALRYFGHLLDERERLFVGHDFMSDPENRIAPTDAHWTPTGHERVARLLYGAIQGRDLLPQLELEPWPAASRALETIHDAARRDVEETTGWPHPEIASTWQDPRQIYTGISPEHVLSPYASLVLASAGAHDLVLRGSFLEAPELAGAGVHVFVEEHEVAQLTIAPGQPFERRVALPADVAGRAYACVRLVSDDWILTGPAARDCVSLRLDSLGFE